MSKTNLQVRIPEEVEAQIVRLAPKSKSDFVREAIEEKIWRELFQRREDQWIEALRRHPEDAGEADAWHKAESWDPL